MASEELQIVLKRGRDGPVRGGHPWVFSGAVASMDGVAEPGAIVRVRGADGAVIGHGTLSTHGAIRVRLFSRNDDPIDADFVGRRIAAAYELRREAVGPHTDAYRLVNGEGDGLPGVVVDRYGGWVVVQYLTAGAERLAEFVDAAVEQLCAPHGIYERSEGTVRREDGLTDRCGIRRGEPPPAPLSVTENGMRFLVDLPSGQKTGFFLDQRENRLLAREIASGRSVLNVFAYTGGFAVAAGLGGATRVVSVETSAPALDLGRRNWEENTLPQAAGIFLRAEAFQYLRDTSERASLIVLDPPAFAKRRRDAPAAFRGYREINRQALLHLEPGGWLMTFSCSHHTSADTFRQAITAAGADAGRSVQIVRRLHAGPDHPVALGHAEGDYLKGFLLRALN
jgi:23S rRNA (cytosine1962-C5)-methyltransferase